MSKLRPPSRTDQFSFPLFAVDWFAEVRPDGLWSWVAYCGGGGSAKTGVRNNILVCRNNDLPFQISTGDQAGCSLKIYQDPSSQRLYMLVAVDTKIQRYSLTPQCELTGELDMGETCEHLAVSPNADQFAIGMSSDGRFKIFDMKESDFHNAKLVYSCQKHTKELTNLAYSPKGDMLVSASRDGTAIVWKDGKILGTIKCSVPEPPGGRKTRPQPVLVRGCDFGSADGNMVVTLHSTKRSEAYLSLWRRNPDNTFECLEKSPCSKFPATALSVSKDKKLVAFGDAEGTVFLWNKVEWKLIKKFEGVHGLPVSCIAARPSSHPFFDEDVPMHIRTGSLDCLAGTLSIFAKNPPKPRGLDSGKRGFCGWLFFTMFWILTVWILLTALNSMYPHAITACSEVNDHQGVGAAAKCIFEEVLWMSPQKIVDTLPPV